MPEGKSNELGVCVQIRTDTDMRRTTNPQVLNEIKAILHPDVVQEGYSLIVLHSG